MPPATERLDVLALAPLPCRSNGRAAFEVGATLQCARLLRGLAALGHRVRAVAVGPDRPHDLEPGDLGPGVSVDWFRVEMLRTMAPPDPVEVAKRRVQFEAALERALAEGRPDVVILGNESHPWYAAEVCRSRGLPIVLAAQGVPTAAIPAGVYPPRELRALVDRLRQVELIVAVGAHLEEVLRGLGLERVATIETGVDTDAFRPRERDPERVVIGSFAHMRPEKRVLDVVASAEQVLRAEPRTEYLFVGDGPEREEVERFVAERGLGARVRLVGEVEHARMPELVATCDVVVVASEREGYSLVCREAQASGAALIVSDIPAGIEAARGGEAGLVFRVGDVDDLAAKTLALSRDEELRRSLGGIGRAVVLENGGDAWVRAWSEALAATVRGGDRGCAASGTRA